MKLAQASKVNVILLSQVDPATVKSDDKWTRDLIEYLKDQYLNKKWLYNLTMACLSVFPVGKYLIALINHLLEKNAKEQA